MELKDLQLDWFKLQDSGIAGPIYVQPPMPFQVEGRFYQAFELLTGKPAFPVGEPVPEVELVDVPESLQVVQGELRFDTRFKRTGARMKLEQMSPGSRSETSTEKVPSSSSTPRPRTSGTGTSSGSAAERYEDQRGDDASRDSGATIIWGAAFGRAPALLLHIKFWCLKEAKKEPRFETLF